LEQRIDGLDGRVESTVLEVEQLKVKGKAARRRSKASSKRNTSEVVTEQVTVDVDSDIEEIPRTSSPTLDQQGHPRPPRQQQSREQSKPLVLKGNYSVPLPRGVTTKDVQAVQAGAKAAGSIAREINAAFTTRVRTSQEVRVNRGPTKVDSSWGGLLGQATRMMTDAINSVDFDAAIKNSGAGTMAGAESGLGSSSRGGRKFGVQSRPSRTITRSVSASVPLSNEDEARRMRQKGLDFSQI